MKKIMLGLLLAISMTAFTAPTFAYSTASHQNHNFFERLMQYLADIRAKHLAKQEQQRPAKPPVAAVPEIDAAGAGIALALAGGLFAVYHERRKSK